MLSGDTTAGEMKLKGAVRIRSNVSSKGAYRMKMKAPKAVISEPGQISCLQEGSVDMHQREDVTYTVLPIWTQISRSIL